ncbi:PEP-CTERM sorting domain-containing protein [Nitrosomonas sp.]|nr:PEP-CTERM sorting domain-containing protein [Nitrosomonas sp.]MBY0484846.1 hypothetical protein [Nitrosomonas sp.]
MMPMVADVLALRQAALLMASTSRLPIPEPEAYAMLLDGLGLLGFVFL